MSKRYLYQELASLVQARLNCIQSGNTEWRNNHTSEISRLVDEYMPSGSGIDNGTAIDLGKSTGSKLVFNVAFHHMDENGFYCGWTDHTITITPSFSNFDIRISGPNKRNIKEYLHDVYSSALMMYCEIVPGETRVFTY